MPDEKTGNTFAFGDIIVGIIVFLPSILLLLFSLTILVGMVAALVKLITIWF